MSNKNKRINTLLTAFSSLFGNNIIKVSDDTSNNDIEFKSHHQLNDEQKNQLNKLLDGADAHPEFAGYNLVKGEDKDEARLVIINNDNVVGFLTPRFDRGFWRAGAIFIGDDFRGKGFARKAISHYFSDSSKRPARVWIADDNKDSQNAFISAGFEKGERRDIGPLDSDRGCNYYLKN
jgi:hypothetical protein